MLSIEFSIWLASKTRWVHLTKVIECPAVPRVGDFMKFNNAEIGDYFPWEVAHVTYHESGAIAVGTELLDNIDERGYSFGSETEFDECYRSYLAEGWVSEKGVGENKHYKPAT